MSILATWSLLLLLLLLLLLAMPCLVWGAEEAEHLNLKNPVGQLVDDRSFHSDCTGPMQVSVLQESGLKKQKELSLLHGEIDDIATGSRLKGRVPIGSTLDLCGFSETIDSRETAASRFASGPTSNRRMLKIKNVSTVIRIASHGSQRPEPSLGDCNIPIGAEGAGFFDDQGQRIIESPHTMFLHNPSEEASMVDEVLLVPRVHFRLNKEPKECKKETEYSSIVSVGRCSKGAPSASNQTPRLQKLEPHQNHATFVDFGMWQAAEIDCRGWEERFNISGIAKRSFSPDALQEEESNGTCEGQNAAAIILGSLLLCSSSEMEDHGGVVQSNSTEDLELEALFNTRVLSAPTEANVPFPSVNFVGSSGDQVQKLAAADVTEGTRLGQWVIFEDFQRCTGTQNYLSAADLSSSPHEICITSAQADQAKELDFLDVLAFVFLPVVAVCFWLLTFSNSPVPLSTQCCNGASPGRILHHIDPLLGLGLIKNPFCNLIGFGASANYIVDSLAATSGLGIHSRSQKPRPSPPNLPHIRVKLSRSPSSGSLQSLKTGSGALDNSARNGNSGERRTHGISGTENYLDSPDGGAHLPSEHVGNAWSGSSLLGSLKKGTTVKLQKPQILSHYPVHQQPASVTDKERRRRRKKKAKVTTSVNTYIASSNTGSSGDSSPPSSPASSPKTPSSFSLPGSSLISPFEAQSGHAHLRDPTSALVEATVANCNKQLTAGGSTIGKDAICSNGKSSPVASSQGDNHKNSCSKSTLSIVLPQWDREPPKQQEPGRPTLSISASFPAYGSRQPGIKQTVFVDPVSKSLNLLSMSTIAPSCRAPGGKIAKRSLGSQSDIAPYEKSNPNKLTITEGGKEDPNVYDIWGDHLGEAGCFSRQQHQNAFAQGSEKAWSLSKLLFSRNSGSLFSNPIFGRSEVSSISEAAIHVSATKPPPPLSSASFSVYSEASSSIGKTVGKQPVPLPPWVAESRCLQTRSNRSASIRDDRKPCLTTDSVDCCVAKRWVPVPYNPPMGGLQYNPILRPTRIDTKFLQQIPTAVSGRGLAHKVFLSDFQLRQADKDLHTCTAPA